MAKRFATCQACTTTRHVFHGHLKVALYTQGILAVDILGPRWSTNTPSSAWTFFFTRGGRVVRGLFSTALGALCQRGALGQHHCTALLARQLTVQRRNVCVVGAANTRQRRGTRGEKSLQGQIKRRGRGRDGSCFCPGRLGLHERRENTTHLAGALTR
jgi:hypothetical protein